MSGSVSFNVYPSTNRVPGVYFEVDASQANTGQINVRALLIGQMLASGTATAGTAILATGIGDAKTSFGVGSMLTKMLTQYRNADAFGEVWCLPLADNGAGVAATGTVAFAGTATANGTLNLYVAGQLVQVAVNSGDVANTVATNLNVAINLAKDLPCTSAVITNTVTLTARHKGLAASDIDIRLNYYGKAGGEFTPAGITPTIVQMTGGITDPTSTVLTSALAGLADKTFDFICMPYTATAQLAALETWLNDTTGRWSWLSELFGGAFSAYRGTVGALTTFGLTNNNQHVSILGFYVSPTPAYLVAADYTGVVAGSLRVDPALPLQFIALNFLAPPEASRATISERNTLLYSGISTFRVNDAAQVILERAVTSYQLNAQGGPDTSYLDVETLYTLAFLIRDLRTDLQTKFARKKLVSDDTRIPFGVNFTSAKLVGNEVIANYRKNAKLGLCQNPDQFAQQLVAENAGNGQVSILAPFQLANQLRIIAVLAQFSKP